MSEEDHATIEGLDLRRQSITLSGFLLDRIAEDEAKARTVEPLGAVYDHYGDTAVSSAAWLAVAEGADDAIGELIVHVAEPSRVLAECAAKRRIVEDIAAQGDGDWAPGSPMIGYRAASGAVLRALATIYADHPDCRDEWKP